MISFLSLMPPATGAVQRVFYQTVLQAGTATNQATAKMTSRFQLIRREHIEQMDQIEAKVLAVVAAFLRAPPAPAPATPSGGGMSSSKNSFSASA